ncbi:MAG: hypothetical protein ACTHJG_02080 [Rhodanobacteraceae bacterium]
MSSGAYTKLFASITESTVWGEPYHVRIVWITLLAMADARGNVFGSIPGVARRANVSVEEAESALEAFLAPDRYSRTPDQEGRRIEPIDGGWRLINHAKYRAMRSAEERREYFREQKAQKRAEARESGAVVHECPQCPPDSTEVTPPTPAPTPERSKESSLRELVETRDASSAPPRRLADALTEQPPTNAENGATDAAPRNARCPVDEIVALYHELLPMLPKCQKLTKARRGHIQQRWREDMETLDDWRLYFEDVRRAPFLIGQSPGTNGRPPFRADLHWLCLPENFAKVYERKYHQASSGNWEQRSGESLADRAARRARDIFGRNHESQGGALQ